MCAHVTRESRCEVGLARGGAATQHVPVRDSHVEVSAVQGRVPGCVEGIMRAQAAP